MPRFFADSCLETKRLWPNRSMLRLPVVQRMYCYCCLVRSIQLSSYYPKRDVTNALGVKGSVCVLHHARVCGALSAISPLFKNHETLLIQCLRCVGRCREEPPRIDPRNKPDSGRSGLQDHGGELLDKTVRGAVGGYPTEEGHDAREFVQSFEFTDGLLIIGDRW